MRSASVSRTSEAESCSAAALSFASVGSTAMASAFSDGWDDIFSVFTATRFFLTVGGVTYHRTVPADGPDALGPHGGARSAGGKA